jgi:hypothetical protein
MELQDALTQIAHIRKQMARVEWYRGYRAVPVAFSGFLALAVAAWQAIFLPNPSENVGAYLTLWIATAAVSAAVAGIGMALRYRETGAMTRLAIEQFFPCVVAGGLVTLVLVTTVPEAVALLPGLWAVTFSLGVFASCRLLPGTIGWVGVYYLVSGLACLALARGPAALSPWAMAVSFGGGQLLTAAILYRAMERGTD